MTRRFVVLLLSLALAAPVRAGREFVATESDFACLTDGVRASGMTFYVAHKNKRLRKLAIRKTRTGKLGRRGYPVGTILQLFPFEAMVKRGGRFNPAGHGWEYFKLAFDGAGRTVIAARGGAEVSNFVGSCQGCHEQLAPTHDAVCEFVVGASGLGLTDEQIAAAQAGDPRCAK